MMAICLAVQEDGSHKDVRPEKTELTQISLLWVKSDICHSLNCYLNIISHFIRY